MQLWSYCNANSKYFLLKDVQRLSQMANSGRLEKRNMRKAGWTGGQFQSLNQGVEDPVNFISSNVPLRQFSRICVQRKVTGRQPHSFICLVIRDEWATVVNRETVVSQTLVPSHSPRKGSSNLRPDSASSSKVFLNRLERHQTLLKRETWRLETVCDH